MLQQLLLACSFVTAPWSAAAALRRPELLLLAWLLWLELDDATLLKLSFVRGWQLWPFIFMLPPARPQLWALAAATRHRDPRLLLLDLALLAAFRQRAAFHLALHALQPLLHQQELGQEVD